MSRLKFVLLIFLLPLIWMSCNAILIYQFSSITYDQRMDVAIVLGAGTHDGVLSPVFRERVNHGISLVSNGRVEAVIFTGGVGEGQILSDSQVAKDYALENGVEETLIFIEEQSTLTLSNLENAREIMEKEGFKTALIVSDPYHMKRAMAMCNKLGMEALPSPTPTSMYRSWNTRLGYLIYEAFYYSLGQVSGRYE